jgi:hypothetical protein
MCDRELTQLISTAKHYLDAAETLPVLQKDLDITVSANSGNWPVDRRPRPLPDLDCYSAHLASCATRLATIHEILKGGTGEAWKVAYPNKATITDKNLSEAITNALEILLRDNVAHSEVSTDAVQKAKFRKTALDKLTFDDMHKHLRSRYQKLADELKTQNVVSPKSAEPSR